MSRLITGLGILAVLLASMAFAGLNGGQRVTLRLGFTTFYRVPLSVVAFGALIVGMVIMLFAGISSDFRVRRILRERLLKEDLEERSRMFVDHDQTSLFDEESHSDG